ncbi:MAG: VWA domain-containing protein [Acidobacteriia bacterium]|jgi:VWFA-related protein|nr:VWA domain-containing protein [Terriglobia bacterium]
MGVQHLAFSLPCLVGGNRNEPSATLAKASLPAFSGIGSRRTCATFVSTLAVAGLVFVATLRLSAAQDTPPKAEAQAAAASQPAAGSAEAPKPPDLRKIRVRVEVVNVPVTVLGKRGRPVINLNKEDFAVYEDGVRQTVRYFSREVRPPLRIGLILDTSNSARRALDFEKDAASEFVFNMLQGRSSKHQIFLQTFDATSSLVQDFTNEPELLNEKIRGLKAGGGKALYDAIYFACKEKMLKSGPPEDMRRVLVVVSDGIDVQSERSLAEAISMAHRAETIVYALGIVAFGYEHPGNKILAKMAEETGGKAEFPREETPGTDLGTGYFSHGQIGDTSQNKGLGAATGIYSATRLVQLAESLESIGRELNEQYSIGYSPKKDKLDGTYRTIRVEAKRKGLTVRAKPGYFAAAE